MTLTTIKVTGELRDILKKQAGARGLTLGEYLMLLAEQAERRQRFDGLRRAMRDAPPDDDYRREARVWQSDAWG